MDKRLKQPEDVVLVCFCCKRPFAILKGDTLMIESRHDTETHRNFLSLEQIERLLRERRLRMQGTSGDEAA